MMQKQNAANQKPLLSRRGEVTGLWVAPAAALVVLMPDLSLMFFVFAVLLTVLMVVPGTAGANRYGRNRFPHHSSFASSGFGGR